jgi:hypothetical protein
MNNKINGILFVGDLNMSSLNPPDRIGGSFLSEMKIKVDAVVNIAKEKGLMPFFIGNISAGAFDVDVFDYLVNSLIDTSSVIKVEQKNIQGTVAGLLVSSRVVDYVSSSKESFPLFISDERFLISLNKFRNSIEIFNHTDIAIAEVKSAGFKESTDEIAMDGAFSVSPLSRIKFHEKDERISVVEWNPGNGFVRHFLSSSPDAFSIKSSQLSEPKESGFARMLKEETERAADGKSHELITGEMKKLFDEMSCSQQTINMINDLYQMVKTPTFDDLMED